MARGNDLRQGNILKFVIKNGNGGTITYKVATRLTLEQMIFIRDNDNAPDFWEPVPLTHELLLNCGFVKLPDSNGLLIYSIKYMDLAFYLQKDEVRDCFTYGVTSKIKIRFLHQLQNLWFVVQGGEELTVNL